MGSNTTTSLEFLFSRLFFAQFLTRKSSTWPNVFDSTYLTKGQQKKQKAHSMLLYLLFHNRDEILYKHINLPMLATNNNHPSTIRRFRRQILLRPARIILLGLVVLSFALSFASSSSVSSIPKVPGKRRRSNQLFRDTADFSINSPGRCDGKANIPTHRKACGLYIWDFPSALLYIWCHRLLKDRVYEGKGGYIFVRYESNSILKLLYPCTRYSPNKCAICGGSYEDHLELWWSKHLYSPFDLYLDQTYNDALTIKEEENGTRRLRSRRIHSNGKRNRTSRKTSLKKSFSAAPLQVLSEPPRFSFHKRYVEDVSDIIRGITNSKDRRKRIKEKYPGKSNHFMVSADDVTYIAPHVGGYENKIENSRKDAFIDICAIMLYGCVDAMIKLQQWEFKRKKARKNRRF